MINRHTVLEVKRDLDRLIRNSEKLGYLLDEIENGRFEIITMVEGGGHRIVKIEELKEILNNS